MATERQIAANRANSMKSTGPVTPEGKAASALNSTRDALTAQECLMPDEDRAAHDAFCDELIADLLDAVDTVKSDPAPAFERQLAQSIAEDSWRLNRMKAAETTLFTLGHFPFASYPRDADSQIEANGHDSKRLQLLTLYIQRTSREIHHNLQLLRELQTERKTARAAALKQAADLLALHQMKHPRSKHKFAEANPVEPNPAEGALAGLTRTQPGHGSIHPVIIPTTPGQRSIYRVNGFVFSITEVEAALTRQRHLKQAELASSFKFDRQRYLRNGGSLAA